MLTRLAACVALITCESQVGETTNCAPAAIASCAVLGSSTVPTPSNARSPKSSRSCAMPLMAPGVVVVTSIAVTPPDSSALVMSASSSAESARMTATTPAACSRATISARAPLTGVSPLDPRAAAAGDVEQLVEVDHARVAARRLEQRAVGRAEVHALLRRHAVQETVREPRAEPVAAAHAVFDLQVLVAPALVERTVHVEDRGPVVDQPALDLAQGRADHLDRWVRLRDIFDHALVRAGVERAEVLVDALHLDAKHLLEIFLVADQ